IAHGEPSSLEVVEGCDRIFRRLEIWTYSNPQDKFSSIRHYLFYSLAPLVPRKLWRLGVPESDVFVPGSCRRSFEELHWDCLTYIDPADRWDGASGGAACRVYQVYGEQQIRQSSASSAGIEYGQVLAPPKVPIEDLAELSARFPGVADARAKPIAVESEKTRPSTAVEVAPTPSRALSYEEIRQRIIELPPKQRHWLELAAPLLTTGALVHFPLLSSAGRDRFIRDFFKRRS